MNKVSIIGFGRFGAMLHSLLSKGFEVDVYDKNIEKTPVISLILFSILSALILFYLSNILM